MAEEKKEYNTVVEEQISDSQTEEMLAEDDVNMAE